MLEPPVTPIRKANDGLELPATGFGTYKVNGLAAWTPSSRHSSGLPTHPFRLQL